MILLVLTLYAADTVWIETTQRDFADGWFTRDLYSSHRGDGSVEFVGRFDLNNDDYLEIPGCSWVMWGSSSGYSTNNKTDYSGGGGCDAADINVDGYPEFLTTNMGGSTQIFWGDANGPDPSDYLQIVVDAYNNEGIFAADFNKDGYLDLLASIDDGNAAIFWGSAQGYSRNDLTPLPCFKTGYNPEAADLNKDGWLDAIVTAGDATTEYIYWGGPEGPQSGSYTTIKDGHNASHGVSLADLNYDGWLDIVLSSNTYGTQYGSILWGSGDIYQAGGIIYVDFQLPLPDRAFGGSSIADLNADGYLDIVFFGNDDVPPRIFLGDADGISPSRYTDLGRSFGVGSGGMVADYTGDGSLDIVELSYGETVLFHGPDFTNYDEFNVSSHHGFSREIGNVYTREYKEEYYSSIFDAGIPVLWTRIYWEDSLPGESNISLAVRTGSGPDTSQGWSEWVQVQNGAEIPVHLQSRYIQYRATFEYPNPAHLPVLFLVGIEYTLEAIIVRPDRWGAGFPGDTLTYELEVLNYTTLPDVVEISSVATQPTWFHEIRDSLGFPLGDADSDGSPDVGELGSGDSTKLLARVGIPLDLESGVDTMIVYGHSSNSEFLYDSAIVITTILPEVSIVVDPDQDTFAYPGQEICFQLWGANYGKWSDVIDLSVVGPSDWSVELLDSAGAVPLTDHDADGTPDLGSQDRGDTRHFTARVTLPAAAQEGSSAVIRIVGHSSRDAGIFDEAVLLINVLPEVSILVEPDQDTSAYPGQEICFQLWGANYGKWADVIDLAAWSRWGWKVELFDSAGTASLPDNDADGSPDLGLLDRGDTAYFTARVRVPPKARANVPDTIHIVGRSSNDSEISDEALLVINPLELTFLEIRPDQEASVSPETPSVRYLLEVINHGNGPETGDITLKSALGWETVVYDSTGEDSLTDSNGNGIADVGELQAFGGTCSLYVEIEMPGNIDPTRGALDTLTGYVSAIETTWVYVSSASDGVVRDSAILVTSALPGLSVHNFPNPFRSETRIVWSQPEEGDITLRLADRAGRPVTTIFSDYCGTGVHTCLWEARIPEGAPLAPGVYILLLEYRPEEGSSRRILHKMLCTEGRQR